MKNKIIDGIKHYIDKIKSYFVKIFSSYSMEGKVSSPVIEEKAKEIPIDKRRLFIRNALVGASGFFVAKNAMSNHDDEYSGWREQGHGASEWNELQNKPTQFEPTPHGHRWPEISSKPSIVLWADVSRNSSGNKIVQRAGNGDIHGREFTGTATKARYADLAEKYESDSKYEAGDVLAIGGDKEVTLYKAGMPLAGVVSVKPAFKMNSTEETKGWPYIALKGRIPVKINGEAEKGDYIIAYNDGVGVAIKKVDFSGDRDDFIGISLQSGSGIIEVKV